jgi:hypothetical protein
MASAARGAAYALLTTGFVNVAAALFLYSRVDALLLPDDPPANESIILAVQLGSALLAGIGFVALLVGTVTFMIGPREAGAPEGQGERIG